MKSLPIVILFCLSIICGCNGKTAFTRGKVLYEPRYAAGFTIHATDEESTIMVMTDPWQGAEGVEESIFLSRNGEEPPVGFSGAVVETPVRRIVCMSSTYVAFLDALDQTARVAGVSGAGFIYNPLVRKRLAADDVADVGYDANLNFEAIAMLNPDVVLVYGVAQKASNITDRLAEMGIPCTYIGDYLENTPLGKAEWIAVFGELCDMRDEALRLFSQIESRYNASKMSAGRMNRHPSVMLNAPYRDTWYVPGDSSYMAALVSDAGGNYACAGNPSRSSRPIDLESAFVAVNGADFWLNTNHYNTLGELLADNPRFAKVQPVLAGRVYNNNKRTTPEGGSDFWESAVVRPDLVLRDLIKIMHSDTVSADSLYYYHQLK
jgi:iron complex transport system substrate-binding protein